VACHIGVDKVKIDLMDYYCKGANSWGAKIVIFVHRGPKSQLFQT